MCIVLPAPCVASDAMTKFRVSERLHTDTRFRNVAVKAPDALALWLIAGSFSADKLSEGLVKDDELPWLIPGAETLAAELVTAGIWKRVKGGYQFVGWLDDNPSKEQVEKDREAARKRMAKLRSGEVRPNKRRTRARTSPVVEVPKGTSTDARCARHPGSLAHNCAGCRSEEIERK